MKRVNVVSVQNENYIDMLYRIPCDIRYLIYNYLSPLHLSFEVRNSTDKHDKLLTQSEDFNRYIDKRIFSDFIDYKYKRVLPKRGKNGYYISDKTSYFQDFDFFNTYARFIEKDHNPFLLYHFFSMITSHHIFSSWEDDNYDEYRNKKQKFPGEKWMELQCAKIILKTLLSYEIGGECKLIYKKSLYSREEILMILGAVQLPISIFSESDCIKPFKFRDVVDGFFDIILKQETEIIARTFNLLLEKKDEELLHLIVKKLMKHNLLLCVLSKYSHLCYIDNLY